MSLFIQYHNFDREGLPAGDSYGIHTGLKPVLKATGGQVFLILGIGTPRRYYLWYTFVIEQVELLEDWSKTAYHAFGPGWHLAPPQLLEGDEFTAFRKSCANFVGFRRIDELPFAKTLTRLADQHRPPGSATELANFMRQLDELLLADDRRALAELFASGAELRTEQPKKRQSKRVAKPLTSDRLPESASQADNDRSKPQTPARRPAKKTTTAKPQVKALSIRQPHAEAILRSVKKIEYRSAATKIRGRIQIYASLGRYPADEEADMMERYGIADVACDDLPRGVIVGTVELVSCDGGDWHLAKPERANRLVKPKKHPQPVWFNPF